MLLFGNRNADLQHTIVEFGAGLIPVCTFRLRNGSDKTSIAPLGAMNGAVIILMFPSPLTFDNQLIVDDLNSNIVFIQTGEIRVLLGAVRQ